jgi:hypothetical protein
LTLEGLEAECQVTKGAHVWSWPKSSDFCLFVCLLVVIGERLGGASLQEIFYLFAWTLGL